MGAANLHTPILDRQLRNNSTHGLSVYCDAIIHTDHLEEWEEAIQKCFANSKQITQSLAKGNKKLVIRNKGNTEDHLVIHFYVAASKFMVRAGLFKEENLINFISLIPRLRHLPEDTREWEREQTAEMPTETYKLPLGVNLPPIEKEQQYGAGSHNSLCNEGHKHSGSDTQEQKNLCLLPRYSQTVEHSMSCTVHQHLQLW